MKGKACGLKLGKLAQAAGGLDYSRVGTVVKRFGRRLLKVPHLQRLVTQSKSLLAFRQMSNAEI